MDSCPSSIKRTMKEEIEKKPSTNEKAQYASTKRELAASWPVPAAGIGWVFKPLKEGFVAVKDKKGREKGASRQL